MGRRLGAGLWLEWSSISWVHGNGLGWIAGIHRGEFRGGVIETASRVQRNVRLIRCVGALALAVLRPAEEWATGGSGMPLDGSEAAADDRMVEGAGAGRSADGSPATGSPATGAPVTGSLAAEFPANGLRGTGSSAMGSPAR